MKTKLTATRPGDTLNGNADISFVMTLSEDGDKPVFSATLEREDGLTVTATVQYVAIDLWETSYKVAEKELCGEDHMIDFERMLSDARRWGRYLADQMKLVQEAACTEHWICDKEEEGWIATTL